SPAALFTRRRHRDECGASPERRAQTRSRMGGNRCGDVSLGGLKREGRLVTHSSFAALVLEVLEGRARLAERVCQRVALHSYAAAKAEAWRHLIVGAGSQLFAREDLVVAAAGQVERDAPLAARFPKQLDLVFLDRGERKHGTLSALVDVKAEIELRRRLRRRFFSLVGRLA